jgi:hypothetical protein
MSDSTSQTAPSGNAEQGLPYQMDVYFDSYPALDLEALARFVDGCEPDAFEPCEAREVGDPKQPENAEGLRVGAFMVSQGSMYMAALVHSVPSPAADMIRHSGLSPEARDSLLAHSSFVLLTQLGGEELPPVERLLFLYKVAAGLSQQGAIGVGNLFTGRVLPGGLLRDLFEEPLPDPELTRWEILRTHGEPAELLVQLGPVELQGRRYLATCGYGHCGLPDLLWEYTNPQEAEEVAQMFRNCFTYMMQNGPVIQAGHTMGYDENVAFRFGKCPEGVELPYSTLGVLLVSKETSTR